MREWDDGGKGALEAGVHVPWVGKTRGRLPRASSPAGKDALERMSIACSSCPEKGQIVTVLPCLCLDRHSAA